MHEAIAEALGHLRIEFQYQVLGDHVDTYFPDLRVVAQCDEHGHASYNNDAPDAHYDGAGVPVGPLRPVRAGVQRVQCDPRDPVPRGGSA